MKLSCQDGVRGLAVAEARVSICISRITNGAKEKPMVHPVSYDSFEHWRLNKRKKRKKVSLGLYN